ncbi:MAG: nitroreductase family deazaflavin-dependent oxidoreductase [Chloroflexota bacterium]|nr:nitroreductase family deazaflavin-dependent oxidoreductase [Chloroflexota bacterium]
MFFDARQSTRFISQIHEFWYRISNGIIGGNVFGAHVLLLTTTGRKSGKRYTTPLLYLADGDDFVVIASNGGADRDPDWWRNLKAESETTVQVGGRHRDVRAEAATGDERERLWTKITSRYPVYGGYERRTKREIPVVVLRPVTA